MPMPIERKPIKPLHCSFIPEGSKSYLTKDGESWISIAEKFNLTPLDLIYYNFRTISPPEVNWYLRTRVGCNKTTRDRYNWMFSDSARPGIIYIPLTRIEFPPTIITVIRWKKLSFWLRLYTGDLWFYKKIRGNLGMRIDHHPSDWYAWQISASLLCANIPIKGSPPVGVGTVNSTEYTFEYNPLLINPTEDWRKKGIFVRLAGKYAWVKIKNALPKVPSEKYQPVRNVHTKDLIFKVMVDSPQTGWCSGVGGIEEGRKVKPKPKPNKPQIPWRRRYPEIA